MTGKLLPLASWQMPCTDSHSGLPLPGMEDLLSFSSLWEGDEAELSPVLQDQPENQTFSIPALLPKEPAADLTITCSLPHFAPGEHVFLTIPPLMGRGHLSLNGQSFHSFCSFPESGAQEPMACQKEVELTDLLAPDRHNALELHFEPFRPAGVCDLFVLRTVQGARIQLTAAERSRGEITCTCLVTAYRPGTFHLRLSALNETGSVPDEPVSFPEPGSRSLSFTLPLKRNETMYYRFQLMDGTDVADSFTIPAGHGPRRCDFVLPIPAADAVLYPPDLTRLLERIGKPPLYSALPLSRGCVEALTAAGIALILPPDAPGIPPEYRVHPNIRLDSSPAPLSSGAASAWQLCGLLLSPRPVPPGQSVPELLEAIFGRKALGQASGLPAHLARLHLLHIRLHAELVRQGLGSGALCAAAEWDDPAVTDILADVFRPGRLSLAPLRCACFTASDLAFSVRVYLLESSATDGEASLCLTRMDDITSSLYEETLPVASLVSENRLIHVSLPDRPCLCLLSGRLTLSGTVIDTVSVPVFVGRDAPLEQVLLHPLSAAVLLNEPSSDHSAPQSSDAQP